MISILLNKQGEFLQEIFRLGDWLVEFDLTVPQIVKTQLASRTIQLPRLCWIDEFLAGRDFANDHTCKCYAEIKLAGR